MSKSESIKMPDNLTNDEKKELAQKLENTIQGYLLQLQHQNKIHITCLLDISGSMGSVIDDAIGGFNTFLKEQQDSNMGDAYMTVHMFDDKYETYVSNMPIKDVKPLTKETYRPRGMTALNDALAKTLNPLLTANNKNNIIVILTDGGENSSKEHTKESVKALTTQCEAKDWKFVYLAANQDAFATSQSYGMTKGFTANYADTGIGTRQAYCSASGAVNDYRSSVATKSTVVQSDK